MNNFDSQNNIYPFLDHEGIQFAQQIPDGVYTFRLKEHLTAVKFGQPRVELKCVITDPGEYFGIDLSRWYCVELLKSKASRKGTFIPKIRGDLMIEFCRLFPEYNPRQDRFSIAKLYNQEFEARTRTVRVNNQQKNLPPQLRHSVIAELFRIV